MLLAMYNITIMKNIFGENFFRSIFVFLTLAFIFCLTSCSNLFSRKDDEQKITVIGRINLDSNLSSDFLISPEAEENRSATPSIDGTTYEYYIKASKGSTTRDTTSVDNNKTFTLALEAGTWDIEACVRTVTGSDIILYNKQSNIELSEDNPIFNLDFYLTPFIADPSDSTSYYEGSINLSMTVPSSISYLHLVLHHNFHLQ